MSERFEEEVLNIVQEKLRQAAAVAIAANVSGGGEQYPSEQFIMFVYEKLQQEEYIQNGSPLNPFLPAKKASIHMLNGGKNDNR